MAPSAAVFHITSMGFLLASCLSALSLSVVSTVAQEVFISEIHYDNFGGDSGEAVEVTGPAGTSLDGWSIPLYNGNGGGVYATIPLSGIIPDQGSGFGALGFTESGIQNGIDGLALVDARNSVLQFLSYEGRITASNGPAEGATSIDIGVTQTRNTLSDTSLQLVGTGSTYNDFSWIAGAYSSFGQINAGMSFEGECVPGAGGGEGCVAEETPNVDTPVEGGEEETEPVTPVVDVEITPDGLCAQRATPISSIQGSGTDTPLEGNTVIVKGVVTAVFPRLSGLFVQDSGDGNSATSDGIFVYLGQAPSVSVGDEVVATGSATDLYSNTQITVDNVASDLAVCSTGNRLPAPVEVTLPSDESTLESVEGMLVSIRSPVVTDNYNAGTYGEITVAAERMWQFTQINKPGSPPAIPKGTSIIIDDGATGRFPNPDVYVDQASVVRVGQTLNDVQGILNEGFGSHRLQPTSTLSVARPSNPRPTSIPEGRGNVRVASFNVLNYFTTLNARGAKTVQQRDDQLAKITKGALALNADVIAIVEVENDYGSATPSIQVIVDSINAQDAGAAWRYVVPSTIPLGSDQIAVGIIYDSNKIATKGSSDVLDYADSKTRASLAQTLEVKCGSTECPAFTLVVNHLKSKGSSCDSIGDPDAGDGQGNCNGTRTKAMSKLLNWLSGSVIGVSPDPDIVITGDLNSYAMEDPIQTAIEAGYSDLSSTHPDFPRVSSYVFRGESGTLDYIMASASAASQKLGETVHYSVNADETGALEYDNCGTNPACTVSLDQYRCSDHDMTVQDFLLE